MNKRKTRGGISRDRPGPGRSVSTKTPDRETREMPGKDDCEGVYKNARFTHTITSLIGNSIRVETQNSIEFEGILKTFSPQLEMVLEWVHQIDPKMPDCLNLETVKEKMVFPIKDIVRYYAVDVDLAFATKDDFQTDSQISANRINGEAPMKQLQEWIPEGEDESHDLEEGVGGLGGNSNGWSPHEMFAKNEEFGVQTTFDPNLSGYTVQLSKGADSADWREKERKAAAIAAEIEGNANSKAAVELENGDEEEAFSAVVRGRGQNNRDRERESPGHGDQGEKPYVPPGRRDERGPRDGGPSQRGRGGRGVRTTPPGSRTTPPPRYEREHRDSHDDGQSYRGNRYDRSYSGSRGGFNNDRGDRGERHSSDRYDRGYNNDYRGDNNRGSDRYNRQDSHSRDHRANERNYRPQSGQKDEKKVSPIPEPEKIPEKPTADRRKSGEGVRSEPSRSNEAQRGVDTNRTPPEDSGLPQRGDRGVRKGEKSREQSVAELRDFNEKFNLANQTSPQPQQSPTPTVSVKTGGSVGGTPLPSPQPGTPAADVVAPTTPQPVSPGQPTTPVASNSSSPGQGSASDSAKKSTLNPNAKEFTFNPKATEFTPRGTSGPRVAPTPPRPQTPSTPNSMGVPQPFNGGYITLAPGPGQVGVNHVNVNSQMFVPHQPMQMANSMNPMQMQQQLGVVTSQYLQNPRPMGNNTRPQGKENSNNNSSGRPDLPSPMAVTGHPILAGGVTTLTGQPPHGPQNYFHPGQAVYGQPQGHPVVRMITIPSGGVPGGIMPGMMPVMSSHADTITQPTMSGTHNMWTQPSPHPPPSGVPPPIAATPPNHGTQPNTPAPSPGLQQMYPGHPPQPASLPPNYPQPGQGPTLMVMPGHGAGFPGHIPTSGAPQQGMHPHMGQHALMGAPAGQPVTSMAANMMPHFQYMQQHQSGQPHITHLMAQHNQQ